MGENTQCYNDTIADFCSWENYPLKNTNKPNALLTNYAPVTTTAKRADHQAN